MESREAVIRELKKGGVTQRLNNLSKHLSKLVGYAHSAYKDYSELHVSDEQMDALIDDKRRKEAGISQHQEFLHGTEPSYKGIKLLARNDAKMEEYRKARLPERSAA